MLGCILRKIVPISSKDLVGHKENLLLALNRSYEFPPDVKKLAKNYAMSKWPKMLRVWKSSAHCNLVGKDFEAVKRLNPTMDHEEWTKIFESSGSESGKEVSDHFRNLQKNLPGNHLWALVVTKLQNPKWEKEATKFIAAGKQPSFWEHRDRDQDFRFLRARAVQDLDSKELVLPTQKLCSTEENLVTSITTNNLVPTTYLLHTLIIVYHNTCIFCREK